MTQAESKQLVSCLLTLIDGVDTSNNTHSNTNTNSGGSSCSSSGGYKGRGRGGVFIIATSSKPNNIDPAMRRPGICSCSTEYSTINRSYRTVILLTAALELNSRKTNFYTLNMLYLIALPCLALPCLALPCLALPCLALPCLVTFFIVSDCYCECL